MAQANLLDLPFNIQTLRTRFFTLDTPVTMSVSEFHAAWRFLDNIYVRNQTRRTADRVVEYYWCRLWRKTAHTSRVAPEERKRKRTVRSPVACPCRVRAVTHGASITFSRIGEPHNHDYSALEHKVTTGVRELAAKEVSKGYKPAEIAQILKSPGNGNMEALLAAGGSGLTIKDIHNARQAQARRKPSPAETEEKDGGAVLRGEYIRQVLDGLHRRYHELESMTAKWPAQAREEMIGGWIRELEERTMSLRRYLPGQIVPLAVPQITTPVPQTPVPGRIAGRIASPAVPVAGAVPVVEPSNTN